MVLVRVRSMVRTGRLIEFSGVVEGVGERVASFAHGDEVLGTTTEVFANYVCIHCASIRHAADESSPPA